MAGLIDLRSGSRSYTGTQAFRVDKSPLDQLNEGIEDVLGKQGGSAGGQVVNAFQSLIDSMLGIDFSLVDEKGTPPDGRQPLVELSTYFTNLLAFLGDLNPLSPDFDIPAAARNFATTVLHPTQTLAPLVTDATAGLGLSGFVPLENLALEAIEAVIGGAQELVDAILSSVGVMAGSGDEEDVSRYFTHLVAMLGQPRFSMSGFDPVAAAKAFLTDMLVPVGALDQYSPLDAAHLFNTVSVHNIAEVSVGAITTVEHNLLANPIYDAAGSIINSTWTWAEGVSRSGGTGCATTTAANAPGIRQNLFSNLIPVSRDQTLAVSGHLQWDALTSAQPVGTPLVEIALELYQGTTVTGSHIVTTVRQGSPHSWWTPFATVYTVPDGVTAVRLRSTMHAVVQAGQVWVDEPRVAKTNLMPQHLVHELVDNLNDLADGIILAFDQIADKAEQQALDDLQTVLGGTFGTDLDAVEQRMNEFLHGASPLNGSNIKSGEVALDFLPALRTEMDNNVQGLLGLTGSGFTHDQSLTALQSTAANLSNLSVQLAQLQHVVNTTIGKRGAADDFARRVTSGLGPNWNVLYTVGASGGNISVDGHYATWVRGGIHPREYVAVYAPNGVPWHSSAPAVNPNNVQMVQVELHTQADDPLLTGITGTPAYNDVLARVSDDGFTYTRFRIGGGQCWIHASVAGVLRLLLGPVPVPSPGPGAVLGLQVGTVNDKYFLAGMVGPNVVISGSDTGRLSDVTPLGVGMGGAAGRWTALLTQSAPGQVGHFSGGDL